MITWLAAGQHLHDIIFRRNIHNAYISIGQYEASKVGERIQFLIDNLPDWFLPSLGLRQTGESKREVEISTTDKKSPSIIMLMHSGEKAGRSIAFYRTTLDEFAFQNNAKKIYEGMNGRSIYLNIFSTPAYSKAVFMYRLWSGSIEGVDCSTIHYSQNPDKDPNTKIGQEWAARKKIGVSDENWRREQECEWVSEGGLVYKSFSRRDNIVDPIALDPDWDYFRGIDFGWQDPFVHLWVARWKCGSWYRWYIFNELYQSEMHLSDLSDKIKAYDNMERSFPDGEGKGNWKLHGRYTKQISDAAGKREREELRRLGIPTIPCKKGYDSINTKINLVREALLKKPDGQSGLLISKNCVKTIMEFESYMYPKEVEDGEHGDKPLDKFNHAMDVIGDILITVGTNGLQKNRKIVYAR
jgi:hypothetical protein